MITKFKLIYFKESGKYYSEATVEWECRTFDGGVYMPDVCSKVRQFRKRDQGNVPLPGLCGGWDGPILIDTEFGVPCLIMPENKDDSID